MIPRPDTAAVRDNLKDFQLRTVDYVFNRLYGPDSTRRFLVADEVGLGKTLPVLKRPKRSGSTESTPNLAQKGQVGQTCHQAGSFLRL
jgi:hypothetical protein